MDPRLLDYYNRELQFAREMGAEFAQAYPRIAARLGLEGLECADPYVERLLEGFAFLAARIQLKLDARHPDFTQHLLELVYPNALAPIPSCAIVELVPDMKEGSLQAGARVDRGTVLRTPLGKGDRTACEFRTAHAVTLWPLQVAEAKYLSGSGALSAQGVETDGRARAAIRLRLKAAPGVSLKSMPLDALTFFVQSTPDIAARIHEQVLADCIGFHVRSGQPGERAIFRSATSIRAVGLEDDEALLPVTRRGFQGYRLLQEYYAFADRFRFFELSGLREAVSRCEGDELEIILAMRRVQPALENAIDATCLRLGCTPVINLTRRKTDRIHVSHAKTELHLVPDRSRPMDFEIFSIERLQALGSGGVEPAIEVLPFYSMSHGTDTSGALSYYTVQRRARLLSTRQQQNGTRAAYVGTECFLSIVDSHQRQFTGDIRQLEAEALCTNRDLPVQLAVGRGGPDFLIDGGAPVEAVRCIAGPSYPRPSPAFGDTAWKLISQLSLNYLSLDDGSLEEGARMLRGMLALYADPNDAAMARQIEGLRAIRCAPVVRRIPGAGPACYGRGLEVDVTVDEAAFEGTGVLPLFGVLDRFFARYASLNSFTQTRLRSTLRGEIKTWPVRVGCRQVI
jgi:type VI secretion system protein ImpG